MAQTTPGTFRLGGDISFTRTSFEIFGDDLSISTLFLRTQPGYFVAPNLLVGADIGLTWLNADWDGAFDNESSTGFLVGPQLTYYISGGNQKLYFPITAYGGYSSSFIPDNGLFFAEDEDRLYYGFNVGLEFIPANALGVRFSFGPQFEMGESEMGGDFDIFNLQFSVGVGYYFAKSEEEGTD